MATLNGPFVLEVGVRYRIRRGPDAQFVWRQGQVAEFEIMRSGHGAVPAIARVQLTSIHTPGDTYEFRGFMAITTQVVVGLYTPLGPALGTIRLAPEG